MPKVEKDCGGLKPNMMTRQQFEKAKLASQKSAKQANKSGSKKK